MADRTKFYKIALQNLNEVINSGVHKLNPSFANEWYLVNQRKLDTEYQENLFEIPCVGLNKSGERGYTVGVRVEANTNKYGPKGNSSGKDQDYRSFVLVIRQEGYSPRYHMCTLSD